VIAFLIKKKSNQDSCTLIYGTDNKGSISEGYAYKARTTGLNCDTSAETKTILAAVEKCANALNSEGAVTGCCTMNHG
jgi:coenzyme F420-reducing hydrogenase delta subunit